MLALQNENTFLKVSRKAPPCWQRADAGGYLLSASRSSSWRISSISWRVAGAWWP